jgi:hypothetical protein
MPDVVHDTMRDAKSQLPALDDATVNDPMRRTDRRTFLERMTAGALALTAAGLAPRTLGAAGTAPTAPPVTPAMHHDQRAWDESWLDRIHGKHRQFFDATSPNDGFSLGFAANFLNQYNEAYHIPDTDLTAIVGIRHFATPLAFNDAIWKKYKFGEFFKVNDPKTKSPATRNIFLDEEGVMIPGSSIPKLQQRGVMLTMCNVALTVLSGMAAQAAGVPKDGAAEEWTAGLVPGVFLVPVGVIAVNRAQEKGCTYCAAG